MKYQTIEGIVYDLETFTEEEQRLFDNLYAFSNRVEHWSTLIQPNLSFGIIRLAKESLEDKWQEYPLYKIRLDLIGRVGVRLGQMKTDKIFPDPLLE